MALFSSAFFDFSSAISRLYRVLVSASVSASSSYTIHNYYQYYYYNYYNIFWTVPFLANSHRYKL